LTGDCAPGGRIRREHRNPIGSGGVLGGVSIRPI